MSVEIPKWTLLRTVGNLTVIRLTVFIPLIGYLIIFNDVLLKNLELAKEFAGLPPISGSTLSPRLLLIYFGLCAVVVGQHSTHFAVRQK